MKNKIMKFLKTKKGKEIINKILDFLIIALICGCCFNQGRIKQQSVDKIVIDDLFEQYKDLVVEYKDYRENSYVLHH